MYQYNYAPSGYAPYEIPDSAFRQQDLGIEWHVQEDGWSGVWRRRGSSNTFDARWTMPGFNQ